MTEFEIPFHSPADAPDDPFELFTKWMDEAEISEPRDPNAMALATIGPDDKPQVRTVLLKDYDQNGFVFYTNSTSRKGEALAAHGHAALCFYWKIKCRQIRIEGAVVPVSSEEADAYYASRPRGSRIGAWASRQSKTISNREALEQQVHDVESRYAGKDDIPRPPHWFGYRVIPQRIEFWQEGPYRLHTRIEYTQQNDIWVKDMLQP